MAEPRSDDSRTIAAAGDASVTLPSERDIEIVRRFAAPRARVFDAWTKADQIAAWWDPRRRPLAACEVDLRPGGTFRFVPQASAAARPRPSSAGTARSRRRHGSSSQRQARRRAAETVGTLIFDEQDGWTTLTIRMSCASREDRDALLRARVDAGTVQTLASLELIARQGNPQALHK